LNPLDFFLWGYINDTVYSETLTTRLNMMERIRKACEAITPLMLENVQHNFRRRLLLCLENNGAYFEHLLHAERADNNALTGWVTTRSCLHWLGHHSTLPSLAGSPLDLAFTGWVITRPCLHWLGHHTTLPSLAGTPLDLAFTGWVTTRPCLHWLGHILSLETVGPCRWWEGLSAEPRYLWGRVLHYVTGESSLHRGK